MAFTTALSGLNAASKNIQVTGNNIANANTTGFKKSRAEFADVYAASIGGVSNTAAGSGVKVAAVAQQFQQGNIELTDNSLDMAISGDGFFVLGDTTDNIESKMYTRSGEFKLNKDGLVVNNQGHPLLAYQPNGTTVAEGFSTGVLQTLELNSTQGFPTPTSRIDMQVNLDASNGNVKTLFPVFDPANSNTFTNQSSSTVYDSLGNAHTQTSYFVAAGVVAGNREWEVYNYIDGNPVDVSGAVNAVTGQGGVIGEKLVFDSLGQLIAPTPAGGNLGEVQLVPSPIANSSANPLVIKMDYANSTHFSNPFSVDVLQQDGLPAGQLTGISIDETGIVFARFSNGGSTPMGKVALSRFPNPQGLQKLGDTLWAQGSASGEAIPGEAGANNFGLIQSGALEGSNVDLAAQLVNLIIAQQTYQANAETIQTEDTITQTILNIR